MVGAELPYLPHIVALSALLVAVLAWRRSRLGLPATPEKKPTPPSLDQSLQALDSALSAEKISHQLQKLENRLRMREVRGAKDSSSPPPNGADKATLFRYYGFKQVGPQFAQHQLDLERASSRKDQT